MKVNKKLLQQHLSSTMGKVVTLKDISSIQSGVSAADSGSDLGALVTRLRESESIPYIANHSRWKSFTYFAGQLANAKLTVKHF